MDLTKRFLLSRPARVLTAWIVRGYRTAMYGSFLFRHDPALRRLLKTKKPVLFAVWHQDFVHTLGYLSRYNVRRPTHVLASASRDGGLAVAAAEGVGFRRAIRGSSARGGAGALLRLHRMAKRGLTSFAVVCDGPRPPPRVLKPGVLHLARDSGLELWLVRTSYRPVKELSRSWARFHMPHLGARAVCFADGPIHVAPDLDRQGLEAVRVQVEGRLNDLADRADAAVSG